MPDFSLKTKLNENNIQAPFQYKPAEDEFILNEISDEIELNNDNVRVRFLDGQKLFCVDLGYSIDGEITEMTFAIDKIKVFPALLNSIKELKSVEVKDNAIYFVDDTNFKSIAFLPKTDYGKVLSFTITTYASTFSSFMFDEIAKKINSLDTDFPIKNFYPETDYKENDIIKKDGYLYKVITNFTSNDTLTNSIILTPFRRREDSTPNMYDLIQDNNQFFIVNSQDGEFKPLTSIITWQDTINKIYKNTIIIREENDKKRKFLVLKDVLNPNWYNLINDNSIIELYIASDILYNNNEVDNLQDGLDLAFTKIDETNSIISNFNNDLKNDIATKQDKLIMSNNINISDDSVISVKLNNKYDLNYRSYIFPSSDLSYTIPNEILFKLSLDNTDFEATIKKEETKQFIFNCKINIAEEKESILLKIKDIDLIELSQFFIQDKEYELENCILVFKNDMTITIKPIVENTNFKLGELELNYIFTSIYNKNIYFLTNYGYLVLEQDNKSGIPRGSVVRFVKDFMISEDMIKKQKENENAVEMETAEETEKEENTKQIDYIELEIENDIIAKYFDTIDDFSQLKATNGIYFLRTTKDAEDNEIETKTTAKYGLFKEEYNKYKLRITRDDKLEILENDILIISFLPDKNKKLDYKDTIAENLDNTIQALTEMDNTIDKKLENETKARETTDNEINQKINNILNVVYPVGSIYITSDNTFNPNEIFKIGKWEKITKENEIEEVNELGEKKENKWERIE